MIDVGKWCERLKVANDVVDKCMMKGLFAFVCASIYCITLYWVPPAIVHGYMIGTDNILTAGETEEGVVLLTRDLKRGCAFNTDAVLVPMNGTFSSGSIYSIKTNRETVELAERIWPGEFHFTLEIPIGFPLGEAEIRGDAEYRCDDNFLTRYVPIRVPYVFKVTIIH